MSYVEKHTAGSPTDEDVKWTDLRPCDISDHIKTTYKVSVSHSQVKRILKSSGYRKRKPVKAIETGKSPNRKQQFKIISILIALFHSMGNNPIISIDTKKKEALGHLTRNQTVYCLDDGSVPVFDHDYSFLATGKAIPHGIYDIKENKGYITLGNSHETAEFVVDNLSWWWNHYGIDLYPDATSILILCDCGGANGYRHHLFKKQLQDFAKETGIRLIVAHYPPYCSKYNPIERRLFSFVHKTIQNTILTTLEQVKKLMSKTKTKKGLGVIVRTVDKEYLIGLKSSKEMVDKHRILYHPELPKLSYTILP